MSEASATRRLRTRSAADASRRALLVLVLAIAALSCTPVFFRLSELGPTATSFHRTFLALPFFAAWMALERRRAPFGVSAATARRHAAALIAGGAFFAANIACYAWAVHFTAIANASLLSNLSPIFVTLGSFLLFGERVGGRFVAAMLGAIAGTALLVLDKLTLDRGQVLGDGVALVSALCFAAYLVLVARLRQALPSATIMLWIGVSGASGLLAATLAAGESLMPRTLNGWSMLLGLALISYALGQGLLTVALAHLGASFSAVALLSSPVTGALWGWALFAEPISANQALGGVIILGSVLAARATSGRD